MFDDLDDAALVAAIESHTRAEAAAGAARRASIAELVRRRGADSDDDERHRWACDLWTFTAAEVSAAMGVSARAASSEMRIGLTLRDHLPAVAALYADGALSSRIASTITWRTRFVVDDDVWRRLDEAIASRAAGWGSLSASKLEKAIDGWVDRFDPAAVVRTEVAARDRDIAIGWSDDPTVTTSVYGRLMATDAEILKRRLAQMSAGVCDNDPRTVKQRRADALGALAAGAEHLACLCGADDCSAAQRDAVAEAVCVYVVADAAAVAAAPDPGLHGDKSTSAPPPRDDGMALLMGAGPIPSSLLTEMIRRGANVVPVRPPGPGPEPRYRPSTALDRFVRVRDLTCRFPGCDRPAMLADVDHTVPYPDGATHASDLKCLCREHHLLKTFWSGPGGWADQQLPDGTVVWTSPAGRTYRTSPGSRFWFPGWNTTTAGLGPPQRKRRPAAGGVTMPKRRRTRAAARRDRIEAHRNRPPPTR
ncbi:hypothetical protein NIIDNTM18_31350 [Mycolicibacterium litorale]|uniref:HNH nuclease domain-containing protein n=1 Tax=Mycolicibacterium litorale TaxID=758802 RepID=A0A6S6P8P5_9MYCO|nr:HNH endonuclease signature motif containing protein [Mycolicibacterium litorale]BCI53857.1 hypothetical protein NIIDNTM18_31350 [Mycolicibacterium litorale]